MIKENKTVAEQLDFELAEIKKKQELANKKAVLWIILMLLLTLWFWSWLW